ncbi:MAG: hypothetical protein V2J24_17845 [Pseudomonadales bacterium]|jgi:hypothetical protein|nr:hypothetical protein [Pseudomonadales bacterium]
MQIRAGILGFAVGLAFAALHLATEYASGGVVSHHLLADPELPAVSNWFGLLTLPLLGAFAADRIARREPGRARRRSIAAALLALGWGAALAFAFELGADGVAEGLFLGLFVLALFLPLHRAECLAGFVLGMTVTFGGVLPVLVAGVVATASWVFAAVRRLLGRFIDGRGLAGG